MTLVALASGCASSGAPSAVVGVVVDDTCDPGIKFGSGVLVQPDLVLTSAHVLAGAAGIEVTRDGQSVPAEVVAFDPEMDLAYLKIGGLSALPLTVSNDRIEAGDDGVAYVVRDGVVAELPVMVLRRVSIRTTDVYLEGETLRPGFELDADIQGGDSGGAIVIDGKVAGVVWARSRRFDGRSYAIDPERAGDLIEAQLRDGEIDDDIDIDRCP